MNFASHSQEKVNFNAGGFSGGSRSNENFSEFQANLLLANVKTRGKTQHVYLGT